MRYEQVHCLRNVDVEFKRLCGVKRSTLSKPGRPCKLNLKDPRLMTLLYWREYRTLFHLGTTLGVSEGTASRRVRWVEDVLIRSGRFALPKRTERFAGPEGKLKGVVVDATETPVERPKKNSAGSTAASASAIP